MPGPALATRTTPTPPPWTPANGLPVADLVDETEVDNTRQRHPGNDYDTSLATSDGVTTYSYTAACPCGYPDARWYARKEQTVPDIDCPACLEEPAP